MGVSFCKLISARRATSGGVGGRGGGGGGGAFAALSVATGDVAAAIAVAVAVDGAAVALMSSGKQVGKHPSSVEAAQLRTEAQRSRRKINIAKKISLGGAL